MQLINHIKKSSSLFDALQAIQNVTAYLTVFLTFIGAAALMALFGGMGAGFTSHGYLALGSIVSGLGMLVAVLFTLIGISATGLHLNDMVNNRSRRTLINGLIDSAKLFPQLILFAFLLAGAALVVFIAISAVIFVSKIPYLGALLYTVIFPLSALVLGVGLYGWIFLTSLGAPAIWEGNSAFAALKILWGVLRSSSLLVVIIQTMLLGLLVSIISGLLFSALAFGLGMTSLISLPILGSTGDASASSSMMGFMQGDGSSSGHMIASLIGGGVLSAAVIAAPFLIGLAGNCIIFKNISSSGNHTPNECPACHAPTSPGDRYCGNCGTSLQ